MWLIKEFICINLKYFPFSSEAVPAAIYNELPRQLQELTSIDKTRPGDIIEIGRRRIGDFPAASGPQMHADQPQQEEEEDAEPGN